MSGIAIGNFLATARVMGDIPPLTLRAEAGTPLCSCLSAPIASLTHIVYDFATSPFRNRISSAWGVSLVLIVVTIGSNKSVRFPTGGRSSDA